LQRLVDFKMSRIGKLPVEIPSGVNVSLENDIVCVKGPKGELLQKISPLAKVNIEEKSVSVSQSEQSRDAKAIYGTTRSLIANMVQGVTENFSKDLLIEGVGFRATVKNHDVFGKTGTARIFKNQKYNTDLHNALFIGMTKVEDKEFLIGLFVKNPQINGEGGGDVAAPIFSEIIETIQKL